MRHSEAGAESVRLKEGWASRRGKNRGLGGKRDHPGVVVLGAAKAALCLNDGEHRAEGKDPSKKTLGEERRGNVLHAQRRTENGDKTNIRREVPKISTSSKKKEKKSKV